MENRIIDAFTFALMVFEEREEGEDAYSDSYLYPEEMIYEITRFQSKVTDLFLNNIEGLKTGETMVFNLIKGAEEYNNYMKGEVVIEEEKM